MMANPHRDLLAALSRVRFVHVKGPNFSGRSEVLQHIARIPIHSGTVGYDSYGNCLPGVDGGANGDRFAYVGPEVYQSLSGLATTVAAELALNAFGNLTDVDFISDRIGLTPVLGRSAYEVSGGQQAILAVAAGLVLRPRILSLDCCLEQVDASRREALLRAIAEFDGDACVVVADNELNDLSPLTGVEVLTCSPPEKSRFPSISPERCRECLPPREDPPILKLNQIHFSYQPAAPVLRGLDASLEPGRVYWLQGENGSGKSTIAKLLAGVLDAQRGQITTNGKPTRPTEAPGTLVSYHFQNPDFQLFSTTVWEEVIAGPSAIGCPRRDSIDRSRHALAQMAIPEELHGRHPLDLPFALRKRVAVAAAIACGAPWLVLDEPSLNQDAQNTSAMASLIRGLAEAGTGVLLISHSARLTETVPDAVLALENGKAELREQPCRDLGDLTIRPGE